MCKGELTWTQAAYVLRPVPTSHSTCSRPSSDSGSVTPCCNPRKIQTRPGTTSPIQGSAGARDSNLDELSFWGEVVCLGDAPGRVPHPQALLQAGYKPVGQHPGRLFLSSGRKSLFGIGHPYLQPLPVLDSLPWPLDTWGPGLERPGQWVQGQELLSAYRSHPGGSLFPPFWEALLGASFERRRWAADSADGRVCSPHPQTLSGRP